MTERKGRTERERRGVGGKVIRGIETTIDMREWVQTVNTTAVNHQSEL